MVVSTVGAQSFTFDLGKRGAVLSMLLAWMVGMQGKPVSAGCATLTGVIGGRPSVRISAPVRVFEKDGQGISYLMVKGGLFKTASRASKANQYASSSLFIKILQQAQKRHASAAPPLPQPLQRPRHACQAPTRLVHGPRVQSTGQPCEGPFWSRPHSTGMRPAGANGRS